MLKVTEVAFTTYPVTDMKRARDFYENILGLKPGMVSESENGSAWTEYEIGPHVLAIGKFDQWPPVAGGVSAALEVEDFDGAICSLQEHNVKFFMEPMPTPVCHMAVIEDPDGNRLLIHKRKNS